MPLRRFKDELTAVWFDAGGFEHVFCGEPRADELGGMHYRGRYLDLQERGIAGLMTAAECRATELEPPVYTVGVRYRLPGGGALRTACPKGYAYDLGAARPAARRDAGLSRAAPAARRGDVPGGDRATGGDADYEVVVVPRRRDPHLLPGRSRRPATAAGARPAAPAASRLRPPARLALKKSTVRCQASLAAASL